MGILKNQQERLVIDGEVEIDVNPNASSYAIQVQAYLDSACIGSFSFNKANGGDVQSVKVGGVELLTATIAFNTDGPTMAGLVAANIQANAQSPFAAAAVGARVNLTAKDKGNATEGQKIVVTHTDELRMEIVTDREISYPGPTIQDPASSSVTGTYTVTTKRFPSDFYQGSAETLTDNTVKNSVVNDIASQGITKMKIATTGILVSAEIVVANIIHYS